MIQTGTKRIIGFICCMCCFMINIAAQNQVVKNEKIYIQYDKPYYTAGQVIWFKGYLYNNGLPSLLSSELYLQLEDESGKIIEKKKYPVTGATVSGNIILDESLPGGYYTLKGVTQTIAEKDVSFIYSKNIFVYNAVERQKDSILKKKISVQFFPESGHLIDRIKTQVAFKAIDERGNPVMVNGFIKSDSGTVVIPFRSLHDGIGKVIFTPHLADTLYAELESDGKKFRISLPPVQATGVYLKVGDVETGKGFEITRSKKDQDFFDTVKLIVRMNTDTVFETDVPFGFEQALSGTLKTTNLPSGILHFIVLNKDNVPLAERLTFVNNKEYISTPELVLVKRDSSKRGFNSFELKFKETTQRSYSISVTDVAAQDFPDRESIYSRLLLTSDLKGYVYNPAYYFEQDDAETRQALDNLMLTHGWTRYNWKKEPMSNASVNAHFLIMLTGSVNDIKNNQPVSKGTLGLQILSEDSTIQSYETAVDNNGKFKMDSLVFYGNSKIYSSYITASGKTVPVDVRIDKDKSDELFSVLSNRGIESLKKEKVDTTFYQHIPAPNLFEGKYKQLSTVFVKAKLTRPEDKLNEKYASALYRGGGKIVLDNINNPYPDKSESVINYVLNNIRTVELDPSAGTLVNRKNFSLQSAKKWKVEVLLDEVTSEVPSVRSVTMDKVALIKFYEAGFVGVSSQAPGGAVAIYMKKYDDSKTPAEAKAEKYIAYKGYAVTKEFYHPDYAHAGPDHAVTDNRMTLYWNPSLDSGNKKFSFYNNDISKKLSIIIEGFDVQGKLVRYERVEGE